MCAAICWMLHGWLPQRWALLLGGVRYLVASPRPRYAVAAGLGLAIFYLQKQNLWGFVSANFLALANHIIAVGSVFTIALIGSARPFLAGVGKDKGDVALGVYGFFIFGIMIETYLLPHYWAPVSARS